MTFLSFSRVQLCVCSSSRRLRQNNPCGVIYGTKPVSDLVALGK